MVRIARGWQANIINFTSVSYLADDYITDKSFAIIPMFAGTNRRGCKGGRGCDFLADRYYRNLRNKVLFNFTSIRCLVNDRIKTF